MESAANEAMAGAPRIYAYIKDDESRTTCEPLRNTCAQRRVRLTFMLFMASWAASMD